VKYDDFISLKPNSMTAKQQLLESEQKARDWLRQQGVDIVSLQKCNGKTNHVFLAEVVNTLGENAMPQRFPHKVIVRMAIAGLSAQVSPLAESTETVLRVHQLAAQLGLAPEVIGGDIEQRLICLAYAGQPALLQPQDMSMVQRFADCISSAADSWLQILAKPQCSLESIPEKALSWSGLSELIVQGQTAAIRQYAEAMLNIAISRQLYSLPLLPSHSDWNQGNWIHDGERWWLIDWDFFGWRPQLWDWAGMAVEHQWKLSEVKEMHAGLSRQVIADWSIFFWFCACISLVNWNWYQLRAKDLAEIEVAVEQYHYWRGLMLNER
jgi:hypothetical protein